MAWARSVLAVLLGSLGNALSRSGPIPKDEIFVSDVFPSAAMLAYALV